MKIEKDIHVFNFKNRLFSTLGSLLIVTGQIFAIWPMKLSNFMLKNDKYLPHYWSDKGLSVSDMPFFKIYIPLLYELYPPLKLTKIRRIFVSVFNYLIWNCLIF